MQIPLELAYRHVESTPAIEAMIRERTERLERFAPRITSCRVMVEMPHRRQQKGNLYHIRIDITLPGGELIVDRHPLEHSAHEDVAVAIAESFEQAETRLQRFVAMQRGDVRAHDETVLGVVARVFADEGYGFLEGEDGTEYYFNDAAVHRGAVRDLKPGMELRFHPDQGTDGPRASRVVATGVSRASTEEGAR